MRFTASRIVPAHGDRRLIAFPGAMPERLIRRPVIRAREEPCKLAESLPAAQDLVERWLTNGALSHSMHSSRDVRRSYLASSSVHRLDAGNQDLQGVGIRWIHQHRQETRPVSPRESPARGRMGIGTPRASVFPPPSKQAGSGSWPTAAREAAPASIWSGGLSASSGGWGCGPRLHGRRRIGIPL